MNRKARNPMRTALFLSLIFCMTVSAPGNAFAVQEDATAAFSSVRVVEESSDADEAESSGFTENDRGVRNDRDVQTDALLTMSSESAESESERESTAASEAGDSETDANLAESGSGISSENERESGSDKESEGDGESEEDAGAAAEEDEQETAKPAQITLYPCFREEDGAGSGESGWFSTLKETILAANADNFDFDEETVQFAEGDDGQSIVVTGLREGDIFIFPKLAQAGWRFSGWQKEEKTSLLQRIIIFLFGTDTEEAESSDGADSAMDDEKSGAADDEGSGDGSDGEDNDGTSDDGGSDGDNGSTSGDGGSDGDNDSTSGGEDNDGESDSGDSGASDGSGENGQYILIVNEDDEDEIELTYTAQWQKLFSVSYEKNSDAEIGELPQGEECAYAAGESFTVASGGGLTKTGFVFAGWKDSLSGETYEAGEIYTLPEEEDAEDIVFRPQWKTVYALTFYASGEELEEELTVENPLNFIEYAADQEMISLPQQGEMSLEGYHFLGWKDSSGNQFAAGTACLVTGNETFTGVWEKAYPVSFKRGNIDDDDTAVINGDDPEQIFAAAGETIVLPENPYTVTTEKSGVAYYRFVGWKITAQCDENGEDDSETAAGSGANDASESEESCESSYGDEDDDDGTEMDDKNSSGNTAYRADLSWQEDENDDNDTVFDAGSEYQMTEEGNLVFVAQWKIMSSGSVWDGTSSSQPENGSGTESEPYLIQTAAELAWLAEYINSGNVTEGQYFSLEEDLDLSGLNWTPIGICDSAAVTAGNGRSDGSDGENVGMFQGTFLGNGHTIYHLNIKVQTGDTQWESGTDGRDEQSGTGSENAQSGTGADETKISAGTAGAGTDSGADYGAAIGLFGGIGAQGNVSDLYLSDVAITVQAEAGQAKEGSSSADGSSDSISIGAVAGYTLGDISGCRIINGDLSFTLSGQSGLATGSDFSVCLGGIVGRAAGGSITNCENAAAISAAGSTYMIGGIAGKFAGVQISECKNTGSLMCGYEATASEDTASLSSSSSDVEKCAAGGIAGFLSAKIEYCFNFGTIRVCIDDSALSSLFVAKAKIGGIAGTAYGSEAKISDCYSYARLVDFCESSAGVTADDILEYAQIGGIIGGTEADSSENDAVSGTGIDTAAGTGVSVKNCIWLIGDTESSGGADAENSGTADCAVDGTVIMPAVADGSGEISNGTASDGTILTGRTASQFASGEAAYLLDGGQYTHKNVWTQGVVNNESLPVLGTPSLYCSSSGGNSGVTLSSGNAYSAEIYVPEGTTVTVSLDSLSKEVTIGEPYESYRTTVGDTTTIYYYQKYYDTAYVQVEYNDMYGTEEDITESLMFSMHDCDAHIGAIFSTDESRLINSPVRSKFHHLETITAEPSEEPEEPENPTEGRNIGSGGGKGPGTGTGSQPGRLPGSEDEPKRGENGTNENGVTQPGSLDPAAMRPLNDLADLVQAAIPVLEEAAADPMDDVTQPQIDETSVSSHSGGDEVVEEITEIAEEERTEDLTIFEVIQDTLRANSLTAVLLFLILAVIIAVSGYSRYRKSRGRERK